MKVEVIDDGAIIDGLQKVANRITLGLILAAMIVSAAMVMRIDTTFRIMGYPAFAMILFTLDRRLAVAITQPTPAVVQVAIKVLLLSLVVLDATLIYAFNGNLVFQKIAGASRQLSQ